MALSLGKTPMEVEASGTPTLKMLWDYFDFKARLYPDAPVESFGGVSGGGLWRVQIYPHPESGEVESIVALEGVAFWEDGTSSGQGMIRCYGVEPVRNVLEQCRFTTTIRVLSGVNYSFRPGVLIVARQCVMTCRHFLGTEPWQPKAGQAQASQRLGP